MFSGVFVFIVFIADYLLHRCQILVRKHQSVHTKTSLHIGGDKQDFSLEDVLLTLENSRPTQMAGITRMSPLHFSTNCTGLWGALSFTFSTTYTRTSAFLASLSTHITRCF